MFCIHDGVGIRRLIDNGYKLAVITGSQSEDIRARVKNLGIPFLYEGALDKKPAFEDLKKSTGIDPTEMAYVGDDIFDIPLLQQVGFAATVPEAIEEVKGHVHYITQKSGGFGAVREICDYLFQYGAYSTGRPA